MPRGGRPDRLAARRPPLLQRRPLQRPLRGRPVVGWTTCADRTALVSRGGGIQTRQRSVQEPDQSWSLERPGHRVSSPSNSTMPTTRTSHGRPRAKLPEDASGTSTARRACTAPAYADASAVRHERIGLDATCTVDIATAGTNEWTRRSRTLRTASTPRRRAFQHRAARRARSTSRCATATSRRAHRTA